MFTIKRILPITLILGALLTPLLKSQANESKIEPQKIAIQVSKPRQVKGVLKMLQDMKADKTKLRYTVAKVVIHGQAVHEVKKDSPLKDLIIQSKKNNVTVAVCNEAITRLKIPKEDLLPMVEVVGNAFYEMLRLKSLGYNALEL